MPIDKLTHRIYAGFFIIFLFCLFYLEPAFAHNVEGISKGLVGDDREKMRLLKMVSFYAGIFFCVLAVGITLFHKKLRVSVKAGPIMLVVGILFLIPKFI